MKKKKFKGEFVGLEYGKREKYPNRTALIMYFKVDGIDRPLHRIFNWYPPTVTNSKLSEVIPEFFDPEDEEIEGLLSTKDGTKSCFEDRCIGKVFDLRIERDKKSGFLEIKDIKAA